jgi:hypothetical protein
MSAGALVRLDTVVMSSVDRQCQLNTYTGDQTKCLRALHAKQDNSDPSRRLRSLQVDLRLAGVRHLCLVVYVFMSSVLCFTCVVLTNLSCVHIW